MTTIIYDGTTLATDSCLSDGHALSQGFVSKIHKLDDGRVLAAAGDYSEVAAAVGWIRAGELKEDKPQVDNGVAFIEVLPDGSASIFHDNLLRMPIDAENLPVAFGSGMEFALGAYFHTKDCSKAIKAACKYDLFSCEPVQLAKCQPL